MNGPFHVTGGRRGRGGARKGGWPRAVSVVRARPGHPSEGIVNCAGRTYRVAIGRSGIGILKREGDGATPLGRMAPVALLARHGGAAPLPTRRIRAGDGWGDDRRDFANYNRACRLPYRPSHEVLLRADGLYDYILVTDQNQTPRLIGGGSAIFIHVSRAALTPTEGCIAFPGAVWRRAMVPIGPYVVGDNARPTRR
ncbi:L,D-transpeptidase family protein [Acuticoccus kandeliae]|uniref:L,D-transpeptidase family protein n=1 Tax=Acuticoccus kandeliae TaxID=2073160 RepID=UPI0013009D3D|nr:L,D-transpeptidase family protein [Acuticoccus kandeliae]